MKALDLVKILTAQDLIKVCPEKVGLKNPPECGPGKVSCKDCWKEAIKDLEEWGQYKK